MYNTNQVLSNWRILYGDADSSMVLLLAETYAISNCTSKFETAESKKLNGNANPRVFVNSGGMS